MPQSQDRYFLMYKDAWSFHKRFFDTIEDNDEYWQMVVNAGDELAKKYNNDKFMRNLILNEILEIEQMAKYNE